MMSFGEVVEAFESGVAVYVCGGGYVDRCEDVEDIEDAYFEGVYSVKKDDEEIIITLMDCD